MGKKSIETLVGIFVLLGMLGLLFLALKAANLGSFASGGGTYRVTAYFDNIGALKVRAPVRSAGVSVGQVASIALDNVRYQGVVVMDLKDGFQFPVDSVAKILTAGLLGDQYVGLEPGSADKILVGGDTLRQSQSAIILENLIGQFIFNKAAEAGGVAAGSSPAPGPAPR